MVDEVNNALMCDMIRRHAAEREEKEKRRLAREQHVKNLLDTLSHPIVLAGVTMLLVLIIGSAGSHRQTCPPGSIRMGTPPSCKHVGDLTPLGPKGVSVKIYGDGQVAPAYDCWPAIHKGQDGMSCLPLFNVTTKEPHVLITDPKVFIAVFMYMAMFTVFGLVIAILWRSVH